MSCHDGRHLGGRARNFSDRLRQTESVSPVGARGHDRRKALQIAGLSAVLGGVVAIAAYLLPL